MPFMLPAAAATTAIGTGAAVGAGIGAAGALGTGLAAGTALAGGAGIAGLMGGLGSAGALAPGAFGALAPSVAANLAPAAAAQAAGTIGAAAGSVAPGAFGANLASAAAPGLTGSAAQNLGLNALKSQAIGGGMLPGAGQGLAGAYNPAVAQNLAPKFLANSPPLAKPFSAETMLADASNKITPQSLVNAQGQIGGTVSSPWSGGVQSYQYGNFPAGSPLHAGDITSTSNAVTNTAQTLPTGGGQGLNLNYQSGLRPAANTVSETGQLIADPRSEMLGRGIRPDQNFMQNLGNIGSFQDAKDYASQHPYATSAMAGLGIMGARKLFEQKGVKEPESNAMIRPYTYDRSQRPEAYAVSPTQDSSERLYFNDQFIAGEPYKVAGGGIVSLAVGGPVEQMAAMNSVGANTGYPMANLQTPIYSNPAMQRPEATNVIAPSADAGVGAYTGEARFAGGGETQYGRPVLGTNPGHVNPENQARAELAGGRRPSSTAPTAPLPKYTYDPKTMQFTQTVGGNSVTGGIATPAMGSMQSQPQLQPQRAATPINIPAYQTPEQQLGLGGFYDYMNQQLGGYGGYAGYAAGGNVGGISHLGDYSDGGRLLKGPGDGVSDSIPASIGGRQPARLADGEFVVPARIVSELGNGSTEAGARKLYAMMDRIQKGRGKSVGKGKVAVNSKADKYLPA